MRLFNCLLPPLVPQSSSSQANQWSLVSVPQKDGIGDCGTVPRSLAAATTRSALFSRARFPSLLRQNHNHGQRSILLVHDGGSLSTIQVEFSDAHGCWLDRLLLGFVALELKFSPTALDSEKSVHHLASIADLVQRNPALGLKCC